MEFLTNDFFITSSIRNLCGSRFGGSATGSKVRHTSPTRISETMVRLPDFKIQEKIAGILAAYDELIENNQRRIGVLEEVARSLYREWFVHFRFPGHENHPRVSSPLGEVPQGWCGVVSDLIYIRRVSINPNDHTDEHFEHFSIPAFDRGCTTQLEAGNTILSGKYLINSSCVLLSKLNPRIRRVWLPVPVENVRSIASTEFIVLQPLEGVGREFVYETCASESFNGRFVSLAIGTSTSHQRVRPENLLSMNVVVPERQIIGKFSALALPLHNSIQKLRATVANLRKTRDLLLPRLLSGQIKLETH